MRRAERVPLPSRRETLLAPRVDADARRLRAVVRARHAAVQLPLPPHALPRRNHAVATLAGTLNGSGRGLRHDTPHTDANDARDPRSGRTTQSITPPPNIASPIHSPPIGKDGQTANVD